MNKYQPKIVCFSCKFSWGYLANEADIASKIRNWIPVICTGKIDSTQIMDAFNKGADGVLILACPEGNCHYQDGNCEAKKKVYLLQKVLNALGVEPERLRIELGADPEGTKISQRVQEMREKLAKLGPFRNSLPTKNQKVSSVRKGAET